MCYYITAHHVWKASLQLAIKQIGAVIHEEGYDDGSTVFWTFLIEINIQRSELEAKLSELLPNCTCDVRPYTARKELV